MALLPSANLSISAAGGAYAGGNGYACIIAPVGKNADGVPRVFTGLSALIDQHDYAPGVDLGAMLLSEAKVPLLFVPVPAATVGALRWQRATGSGTSIITVTAGTYGINDELDATLTVSTGGTIGSGTGPVFAITCDGGRTTKTVRLGTASTYTIPYVGVVLNFAAGTLVAGDTYSFRTTAPKWDNAGLAAARTALAAQQKVVRSLTIVGDLATSTEAGYVTTQANAYEMSNKRFVYARCQVRDGGTPSPLAKSSGLKRSANFAAATTLAFAEVGATGDTVTRSAGSWITDGFAVGHVVTFAGTASNNVTGRIAALSATVLTFDTTDLVAEGPTVALGTITCVGAEGFVFAEVGATGDTITRFSGSWVTEGFAIGDVVAVAGSASNNVTTDAITNVSATVLTFDTTDLVAEEIGSHTVTITKVLTKAADVALADAAFASVDAQKRIDLAYGRARKVSPITLWNLRRPASWAKTIREYQHDIHIPTWRIEDGPLDGWDLEDSNKNIVEYDERVDGGALAARFSCLTTLDNGPNGAFSALSLTRATDGSVLSRTHNMAVTNKFCSIVQAETMRIIGSVLVLNADGTGTEASLKIIDARVNKALAQGLLKAGKEGQQASSASWSASRSDDLSVVPATMNGVGLLGLNGTIERVDTAVLVS